MLFVEKKWVSIPQPALRKSPEELEVEKMADPNPRAKMETKIAMERQRPMETVKPNNKKAGRESRLLS